MLEGAKEEQIKSFAVKIPKFWRKLFLPWSHVVFLTDTDFFLVKFARGMLRTVYGITLFKNIFKCGGSGSNSMLLHCD